LGEAKAAREKTGSMIIATDDFRIAEAHRWAPKSHDVGKSSSGTDDRRGGSEGEQFRHIVNIQGDEPMSIRSDSIVLCANCNEIANSNDTAAHPFTDASEAESPHR